MKFESLINLILESPYVMDGEYVPDINDDTVNVNFCKNLLTLHHRKIGNFQNYNVWVSENIGQIIYVFTNMDDCSVKAKITLKRNLNETTTIWKHRKSEKGLMTKIFLDFLLKIFPFISCSSDQYELGKQFWINLTNHCIVNGYNVVIINPNETETKLSSVEEFKKIIKDIWSDGRIKIKIYAK